MILQNYKQKNNKKMERSEQDKIYELDSHLTIVNEDLIINFINGIAASKTWFANINIDPTQIHCSDPISRKLYQGSFGSLFRVPRLDKR